MSITGFPDGPPTRSGQSISDYYAGMLCAFSVVSALHYRDRTRQGAAHRPGAARQPGDRARQPRRALHGRRRDPHARGQRLVRRLQLGRLSDDGRPRGHRGRGERRGVAALLRDHRPGRPHARSRLRHRARPGAIAATRSPRIIQGWTSARPKAEVVGIAVDGRRPRGAGQQRRRDGRRSAGAGPRDVRRAATIRSTDRSRRRARRSSCRRRRARSAGSPRMPGEHNEEVFVGLLGHSRDDLARWREAGVI